MSRFVRLVSTSALCAILVGSFSWSVSASSDIVWNDASKATFANGIHNSSGGGEVKSISCPSANECVAVGEFSNSNGYGETFTMSSTNGVWSQVRPVTFDSVVRNPTR